jgi:hypothetical protein
MRSPRSPARRAIGVPLALLGLALAFYIGVIVNHLPS